MNSRNKYKKIFIISKKPYLIFSLFYMALSLNAQQNEVSPIFDYSVKQDTSPKFQLSLYNLNFNKNNEYFNSIYEGYTLFGTQLFPKIIYSPSEKISLEGGVFLLKDFGKKNLSDIQPVFTLRVKENNLQLIFGHLNGDHAHRVITPLYDFERAIHNRIENGSQIILDVPNIMADGWISWEKYIERGDPFREEFTAGLSSDFKTRNKPEGIHWNLPVQLMFTHKGGQIDSDTMPLETFFNAAWGLSTKYKKNMHTSFAVTLCYTIYRDLSHVKLTPFHKGDGWLGELNFKTKYIQVITEYWNSNQFLSRNGSPLYLSQSVDNLVVTEKKRKLITLRLIHEMSPMENFFLSVRFEPYYDILNKLPEYSYGIYATYKTMIGIKVKGRK